MIFKNIDGTTKQAFKIGLRGVTIKVDDYNDAKRLVAITQNGSEEVKKTFSFDEDLHELFVSDEICKSIAYDETSRSLIITYKTLNESKTWVTETQSISISTGTGNVRVKEGKVHEDHLASFDDSTGEVIKDSGFKVDNSNLIGFIENPSESDPSQIRVSDTSRTAIPTVESVLNYVGALNGVFYERLNGESNLPEIDDE